jgi:hypothetical protein
MVGREVVFQSLPDEGYCRLMESDIDAFRP